MLFTVLSNTKLDTVCTARLAHGMNYPRFDKNKSSDRIDNMILTICRLLHVQIYKWRSRMNTFSWRPELAAKYPHLAARSKFQHGYYDPVAMIKTGKHNYYGIDTANSQLLSNLEGIIADYERARGNHEHTAALMFRALGSLRDPRERNIEPIWEEILAEF